VNKLEYWWDKSTKNWVLYPIDENGDRIEWDSNDNPIEALYFPNRKKLEEYLDEQVLSKVHIANMNFLILGLENFIKYKLNHDSTY
jgi:hypothetical protein